MPTIRFLAILSALAGSLITVTARAQAPSDELWWDGFWESRVHAAPQALTFYNGEILASGLGGTANVTLDPVARFDGSRWYSLGTPNVDVMDVFAFSTYDGDLVVGGNIELANSQTPDNILTWNGSQWRSLRFGVDSTVTALLPHDTDLIVAGDFLDASGLAANRVAGWDGKKWYTLGDGFDGRVRDLVEFNGEIVAAGAFSASGDGGTPLNRVARWTGSTWEDLGTGLAGDVFDLIVHQGLLYACGDFAAAGGNNVAVWNGTAWTGVGGGAPYPVREMAVFQGLLFVTSTEGPVGVQSWDGASWTPILHGPFARHLLATPDELVMSGNWNGCHGGYWCAWYLLTWDGTTLSGRISNTPNSPSGYPLDLLPVGGNLVAGGEFWYVGDERTDQLAWWDGNQWTTVLDGFPESLHISDMVAFDGGVVVANCCYGPWIIKLDPTLTQWQEIGASFGWAQALAVYQGELYAGGPDSLRRWSGSDWVPVGGDIVVGPGGVDNLIVYDNKLVAGSVTEAEGQPVNRIAAWNGSTWEALGTGCGGDPAEMGVYGGKLVVSGIQGATFYIKTWDGNVWSDLPVPGTFVASSILQYDGKLFVAYKDWYGSMNRGGVQAWDGTAWTKWISYDATALANYQGSLMVGGPFVGVGGKSSAHMAQYNRQSSTGVEDVRTPGIGLRVFPNPFRAGTTIVFDQQQAGPVTLTVHDIQGRLVQELFLGRTGVGRHEVSWNWTEENPGDRLAQGVYFIRLRMPDRTETGKVVIAP